ncbi:MULTISPECIES: phage regulatory CII family protein [unclassified Chelatococcus]|uniref:phage regulatory CII family protein n=1 Tax=unclassified Chelatococcus TaxID=2638111 RepID=UPI001BCE20BF|nr:MULTISPECIES: phage regulatory CII family protein [unclassified Chelatococcus]MBS7699189.1 hypothetical protein [Chelatococcus sp. YT9]MBX3554970.1 hypothetical protein [Chelatococcus sp.]
MNARYLPASDYLQLKSVSHLLLKKAGGGRLAAAEITRGSESRFSEAASTSFPERFLAVDQVADLEAHCGAPLVTRTLAGLTGHDLVSRADPQKPEAALHHHLIAIVAETGDVTRCLGTLMNEGRLNSPTARMDLLREIDEAHTALAALSALVRQVS